MQGIKWKLGLAGMIWGRKRKGAAGRQPGVRAKRSAARELTCSQILNSSAMASSLATVFLGVVEMDKKNKREM